MRSINTLMSFMIVLFSALTSGSLSAQTPPPDPPPTTGGQSGGVTTPSANNGTIDQSIMSPAVAPTGALLYDLRVQINQLTDPEIITRIDHLLTVLPAYEILYLEAQIRGGNGSTTFAPSIRYSSIIGGIDLAFQPTISDQLGFGVSARFDLSPANWDFVKILVRDLRIIRGLREVKERRYKPRKRSPQSNDLIQPLTTPTDEPSTIKAQVLDVFRNSGLSIKPEERATVVGETSGRLSETNLILVDSFIRAAKSPHFALVAGYRGIGDNIRIPNAAFNISQLIPIAHGGLTPLVSIQGIELDVDGQKRRQAVRFSSALIWQNHIPRLVTEKKDGQDVPTVLRWSWQLGVEYQFKSSVDRGNILNGFARYRDRQHNRDYMLFAGVGRDTNRLFVGASIGMAFDLTKHK